MFDMAKMSCWLGTTLINLSVVAHFRGRMEFESHFFQYKSLWIEGFGI